MKLNVLNVLIPVEPLQPKLNEEIDSIIKTEEKEQRKKIVKEKIFGVLLPIWDGIEWIAIKTAPMCSILLIILGLSFVFFGIINESKIDFIYAAIHFILANGFIRLTIKSSVKEAIKEFWEEKRERDNS